MLAFLRGLLIGIVLCAAFLSLLFVAIAAFPQCTSQDLRIASPSGEMAIVTRLEDCGNALSGAFSYAAYVVKGNMDTGSASEENKILQTDVMDTYPEIGIHWNGESSVVLLIPKQTPIRLQEI
jgi:hypothetical protein